MTSLESQQNKIKDLRSKILDTPQIPQQGQTSALSKEHGHGNDVKNQIEKYANQMFHSNWTAQLDSTLATDIQSVLNGGCVYLPSFFCEAKDFTLLQRLSTELEENTKKESMNEHNTNENDIIDGQKLQNSNDQGKVNIINWSKHLKMENPDFSLTFQEILDKMSEYFDVDIFATRLNFYRDGSDWKPYHHDSHAYSNGMKEDFTMGASFGFTRSLSFLHEPSGQHFEFPQQNGDIFAFDSEVNKKFKHGVPKMKTGNKAAPRFSIIAWGRRRTLNERNSSASLRELRQNEEEGNKSSFGEEFTSRQKNTESRNRSNSLSTEEITNNGEGSSSEKIEEKGDGKENHTVMDMSSVKKMVEDMAGPNSSTSDKKERNEKRGKKTRRGGSSRLQNRFDV